MKLIKLTDLINGKIFKKHKINKLYNLWIRLQMGETGQIKERWFLYGFEMSNREKEKLEKIMRELGEIDKNGNIRGINKSTNFIISGHINFIEKQLKNKIQELKNSL